MLAAFFYKPATRAMAWAGLSGMVFVTLNSLMRLVAQELDPFQTQFLRYAFGMVMFLPWVLAQGLLRYRPSSYSGQFIRGAFHTLGMTLWFLALPHIGIADTTAIGFTAPIFIMIGAAWFLNETMRWDRWAAALVGFAGVVVVVAPHFVGSGGWYNLVMLASSPLFAVSFLLNKAQTRYESAQVIVLWQSLTVTLFSLPLALLHWRAPTAAQWCLLIVCGALGTLAHLCLTQAFRQADISATQSLKFLDLVWASIWGWLLFSDVPSQTTLLGGLVISASTVWITHREARR